MVEFGTFSVDYPEVPDEVVHDSYGDAAVQQVPVNKTGVIGSSR